MPDGRDFRVRCDLNFDPADEGVAQGLYNHIKSQVNKAVNIHPGEINEEIGYASYCRCGHRIDEDCKLIDRKDVP